MKQKIEIKIDEKLLNNFRKIVKDFDGIEKLSLCFEAEYNTKEDNYPDKKSETFNKKQVWFSCGP